MTTTGPWDTLPQARAAIEGLGEDLQQYRSKSKEHEQNVVTSSNSDDYDEKEREREERQVLQLARTFTYASVKNAEGQYINPFLGSEDPNAGSKFGEIQREGMGQDSRVNR